LQLHPTDPAINKALALAGRDEAPDLVDILYVKDRSSRAARWCGLR